MCSKRFSFLTCHLHALHLATCRDMAHVCCQAHCTAVCVQETSYRASLEMPHVHVVAPLCRRAGLVSAGVTFDREKRSTASGIMARNLRGVAHILKVLACI